MKLFCQGWILLVAGLPLMLNAESLTLMPAKIQLRGPESSQRVMVLKTNEEGEYVGEATEGIRLVSSDPEVAVIKDGVVIPQDNGEARIRVRGAGGKKIQSSRGDFTITCLGILALHHNFASRPLREK